ncbi:MAG TPA: hypothetical protein VG796_19780 [Verrucomicrobiales bacterium]|nr:hypothetical protein [Verrucomicrobiales bacterium]
MNTSFIPPRAASTALSPDGSRTRSVSTVFTGFFPRTPLRWLIPAFLGMGSLAARAAITETTISAGSLPNPQTAFETAVESAGEERIVLATDVTLSGQTVEVKKGKVVVFGKYQLIEGASPSTIQFNGEIEAGRQQVFSGWENGDITGTFNTGYVYPEWWGLVADNHDLAINAAIKATTFGNTVSLGSGTYTIRAPLDLSASRCFLEGRGDVRTQIVASTSWSDPSPFPNPMWGPGNNHSAMIWIGSAAHTGTNQSFWTGVRGVTINGYNAAKAAPGIRISGISSQSFVEENSIIENVGVGYFNGFGIGFAATSGEAAVINGLTIRNFWITGGMARDAYGIYFAQNTSVCSVDAGTIDLSFPRSVSQDYATLLPTVKTLTFSANPANNDQIVIGATTYVFKDSIAGSPPGNTVWVLRDQKPGTKFFAGMKPITSVFGTAVSNVVQLQSSLVDTAGNYDVSASTSPNANITFTGGGTSATMSGGTASLKSGMILTFNSQPANGSTLTIGTHTYKDASGTITTEPQTKKTYRFVSSLAGAVEGDVLIDSSTTNTAANLVAAMHGAPETSLFNLLSAVNDSGGEGTLYTTATANASASASLSLGTQVFGSHGALAENDSVTIGSKTYTMKLSPIGTTEVQLVDHSSEFSNKTAAHPRVSAAADGGSGFDVLLTARVAGFNSHVAVVPSTSPASNITVSNNGTLPGGVKTLTGAAAVAATAKLTFNANPANGSTLQVGSKIYTFKTSVNQAADGEIVIGGSATATRNNFIAAFEGAANGSLTNLASHINTHSDSSAPVTAGTVQNDSFTVTADPVHKKGLESNDVIISSSNAVQWNGIISGGAFTEGGLPWTVLTLTAKVGGTTGAFTTTPSGSAMAITETLAGEDGSSAPDYVREIVQVGIHAGGAHCDLRNIHFESTTIGVWFPSSDYTCATTINNINTSGLTDAWYTWSDITRTKPAAPPSLRRQVAARPGNFNSLEPHFWEYGTLVLISGKGPEWYMGGDNYPDRASITNIAVTPYGRTAYIVRDPLYGIHHNSFGHGPYFATPYSAITSYVRANGYTPSAGPPSDAVYVSNFIRGNPMNTFPNNMKTYFVGPIE